jgi:hypothetical protein
MANTTNIDYNYNPDNVIKKTLYKFYIIEELINFVETNIVINVLFRLYNSKDEKFKKNKENEIIQTLQKYGSKLEVKLNKIGEYFDEIEFMNRELIIEIFQKYTESIQEEINSLENKKKETNKENGIEEKKEEPNNEPQEENTKNNGENNSEKKESTEKPDEINEETENENIDLFYNINNSLYNYDDKWKELIIRIIQTHFIEHILKLVTLHDVDSTKNIIIKVNLLSSDVNKSDDNSQRMSIFKRLNINLEKLIPFKLSGIFNTKDDTTNNEGLTTGIESMFGKIKIPNFTLNLFKDNNKETDRIKELKELLDEMQKLDKYQHGGNFLGNIKSTLTSLLSKGLSKGLNIFKKSKSGYYEGNRLDLMEDFVRNGPLKHKYIDITSEFKYNSKLFLNLKPESEPQSDAKLEQETELFPIPDGKDPTMSKKVYKKLDEVQENDKKLVILKNIKADLELKEENETNEEIIADTSEQIKSLELPIPPTYIIEEKYVRRNRVNNMSDISLLNKNELIISEQKEEIANLKKVMDENTKKIQKENEENLIEAANLLLEELMKSDNINDDIKNEFINLKNKIKTLEQDKSELSDTINKSNKNNDNTRKLEDINSNLLEKNEKLQKQLEQILGQNLATDVVSNILTQSISKKTTETYEEKIEELYSLIEKLQKENKNRSLNEEKMKKENKIINQEKEQLQEKFDNLEKRKIELETQLTSTQNEFEISKRELKEKQDELISSQEELKTKEEQLKTSQEELKTKEDKKEKLQKEKVELEEKIKKSETENNELKQANAQNKEQIEMQQEEIDRQQKTIIELRKQIEDNNKKNVILDNQYKSDTVIIKKQQQKIEELNDSLAKLTSEKDQVEGKLKAIEAEKEEKERKRLVEEERKRQEKEEQRQKEEAERRRKEKKEKEAKEKEVSVNLFNQQLLNEEKIEALESLNTLKETINKLLEFDTSKSEIAIVATEINYLKGRATYEQLFEFINKIKDIIEKNEIITEDILETEDTYYGFEEDSKTPIVFIKQETKQKKQNKKQNKKLIFKKIKDVWLSIYKNIDKVNKQINKNEKNEPLMRIIKQLNIDFLNMNNKVIDYFQFSLSKNNPDGDTKYILNSKAPIIKFSNEDIINKKKITKESTGINVQDIIDLINFNKNQHMFDKKVHGNGFNYTPSDFQSFIRGIIKKYAQDNGCSEPNVDNIQTNDKSNQLLRLKFIKTDTHTRNKKNSCSKSKEINEIVSHFNDIFYTNRTNWLQSNNQETPDAVSYDENNKLPQDKTTDLVTLDAKEYPENYKTPEKLSSVFNIEEITPSTRGGKKKTRRKGRTKKKTKTRKK